jgi:nucleoside-diphosphate-sugar epimerase
VMVLRSSSMYGEGSRLRQVIPIFIRQALKGEPITVEGDGSQSRDLNYVKNTATGILNAISAPARSGTWNLGSGKETTIRQLAELIIRITASSSKVVEKPWRPGEQGLRLPLSIEKAKRDLAYSPAYSREEALTRTVEWIRRLG